MSRQNCPRVDCGKTVSVKDFVLDFSCLIIQGEWPPKKIHEKIHLKRHRENQIPKSTTDLRAEVSLIQSMIDVGTYLPLPTQIPQNFGLVQASLPARVFDCVCVCARSCVIAILLKTIGGGPGSCRV